MQIQASRLVRLFGRECQANGFVIELRRPVAARSTRTDGAAVNGAGTQVAHFSELTFKTVVLLFQVLQCFGGFHEFIQTISWTLSSIGHKNLAY